MPLISTVAVTKKLVKTVFPSYVLMIGLDSPLKSWTYLLIFGLLLCPAQSMIGSRFWICRKRSSLAKAHGLCKKLVHFGAPPFSAGKEIDRVNRKSLYYNELRKERP